MSKKVEQHSPLIEEFLKAKKAGIKFAGPPAAERTITTYRQQLRRLENYCGKNLEDIEKEDAEFAVQQSIDENLSQSYRNLMLSAGRGFYDWALRNELPIKAKVNPFTGIRMNSQVRTKEPRHITKSQFDAIIRAMEQIDAENVANALQSGPQTANAPWVRDESRLPKKILPVKLMFYGGLRINEAVSLKIDNVLDDAIIVDGKGGKQRIVPLPKWLIKELHDYIANFSDDDVYVFTPMQTSRRVEGTPLSSTRIHQPFHEAVKRVGLPDWVTPHTLRHSFAKIAMEKTERLDVVQDLLGHENIETTRIYMRNDSNDIKKQAAKIWS